MKHPFAGQNTQQTAKCWNSADPTKIVSGNWVQCRARYGIKNYPKTDKYRLSSIGGIKDLNLLLGTDFQNILVAQSKQ